MIFSVLATAVDTGSPELLSELAGWHLSGVITSVVLLALCLAAWRQSARNLSDVQMTAFPEHPQISPEPVDFDGSRLLALPDGRMRLHLSDGTVYELNQSEHKYTRLPDGTQLIEQRCPRKTTTIGTDGTVTVVYPSGRIRMWMPGGTVITRTWDGHLHVRTADGVQIIEMPSAVRTLTNPAKRTSVIADFSESLTGE